jgi:hypothetical protein
MTCGIEGAMQSRGTCWFFSIINGFLLSSAGQKILFASMEKFYKGLSDSEKAYFDDSIDAPCPLRGDIIKTKRIYFYKFLDQYLCFKTGPRSMSLKSERSARILEGVSLAGTLAKKHMGGIGAHPQEELLKVLKHLGITNFLTLYVDVELSAEDKRKQPPFVVYKKSGRFNFRSIPSFRPNTYSLMCCSITIANRNATNATLHKAHAITGYMCGKDGYLFDSNQERHFPCKWWNPNDLKAVVDKDVAEHYSFFRDGQIDYMEYNYAIFSRKAYVANIHLSCRLRIKKVKTPEIVNIKALLRNNAMIARMGLKPAEIAALKHKMHNKGPNSPVALLNKKYFNSLKKNGISKSNVDKMLLDLTKAGYRVNRNAYLNFMKSPVVNASFNNAKKLIESEKTTAGRTRAYSKLWKQFSLQNRKKLMEVRNALKTKKKSPSVPKPTPLINSPRTARRKVMEQQFENYWKQLTKNNRNTVRKFIASKKSPSPQKKSPSPQKLNLGKAAINTLKTAVARKKFLKNAKSEVTPENYKKLRNYVKAKNENNRNRRDAKRFKIVAS